MHEGFRSIEQSSATRRGMATDQGKTSNMNALATSPQALQAPFPQVGLTTFRPALYAGDLRRLRRRVARRAVRSDAQDADPRLGRGAGRGVRGRRLVEARLVFPARPARRCTRRSRANAARCATRSACSTPRRSARSRSSAPTPPSSSNRLYINALAHARSRPLPLRPDAERERFHPRRRGGRAGSRPTASM